jgi:hypothetical protein
MEIHECEISVPQKKFDIDFVIDKINVSDRWVKVFVSITRKGSTNLPWHSDEGNTDSIYLSQEDGETFHVQGKTGVTGVFAKDSQLEPGQAYTGFFTFDPPSAKKFTFHYPDMEPTLIDLSGGRWKSS